MPGKRDALLQKLRNAKQSTDVTENDFDLTNDDLTDIDFSDFVELYPKFKNAKLTIKKIDISANRITQMGAILPLLQLCDLSSQPFTLRLNHNQIKFDNSSSDLSVISLLGLSQLQILELQSNRLTSTTASALITQYRVFERITSPLPLTEIDLSGNQIDDFATFIQILLALLTLPNIQRITLDQNKIANMPRQFQREQQQIVTAIQDCKSLTHLSIADCGLAPSFEKAIKATLKAESVINLLLEEEEQAGETKPFIPKEYSINSADAESAQTTFPASNRYHSFIRWTVRDPVLLRYSIAELLIKPKNGKQIIPDSPSILLPQEDLGKALSLTAFWQGFHFTVQGLWPALMLGLRARDVANFYQAPLDRFGNTLFDIFAGTSPNQATFSTAWFYNDLVTVDDAHWLAMSSLLFSPVIIGAVNALLQRVNHSAWRKALSAPEIQLLITAINNRDRSALARAGWAVRWQQAMSDPNRIQLTQAIINLAKNGNGLAAWQANSILAAVADSFQEEADLQDAAFQKIRIDALNSLENQNENWHWRGLPNHLHRHYLLWSLGQSDNPLAHIAFDAGALAYLGMLGYAATWVWQNAILNAIAVANYFENQRDCLQKNKVFLYRPPVAKVDCTVCGDLPQVYYGDADDAQGCWNGLLSELQLPEDILQVMDRLLLHPDFTIIDLSRQNWPAWTDKQFQEFLEKLQASITSLDILNLSSMSLNPIFPQDGKIALLTKFLEKIPVKTLIIQQQNFGPEVMKTLMPGLNHTTIHSADFSGNDLGNPGASYVAAVNSFGTLKVANNTIGDPGAMQLMQRATNTTKIADLSGNPLFQAGIDAAANARFIETLDLSGIDLSGIELTALKNSFQHLRHIRLSGCHLSDPQVSELFAKNTNATLESVDLSYNRMTDQGAIVCVANWRNSTATDVNLGGNSITDNGLPALGDYLMQTGIKIFRIADNRFSSRGFAVFVKKLPQTAITVFDASHNALDDDAAVALADMITRSTHCALEEINLANNNIGERGGLALMEALAAKDCSIKKVYLQGNQLTGKVALKFAEVLPHTKLICADLSNNKIDAGGKEIAAALPHSLLEELYLNNNPLGKGFGAAVAKNLITDTPRSDELENGSVGRGEIKAIRQSEPQTPMKALGMAHTNATAQDLQAVCIVLDNSGIDVDRLAVSGNAAEINFSNCQTSAAGRLQPPAIYRAIANVYRTIKEALVAFGTVGSEPVPAAIPKTLTALTQEKNTHTASQARFSYFAQQPKIQTLTTQNESWLPVIQFAFVGLCLLYFFNKYLSACTANTEPHAIAAEEKSQLEKWQQTLASFKLTLHAQKQNHAAHSGLFADIYTAYEVKLQNTQQAIQTALLQHRLSSAQWREIHDNVAAIESNMHLLAQKNRELKKLDLDVRRAEKRAIATGEKKYVATQHTVVTHQLQQEIHAPRDAKSFSLWQRQTWQPTHFQHPTTPSPGIQTLPETVPSEDPLLSPAIPDLLNYR